MAYRNNPDAKLRLKSISFGDWMRVSVALSLGAGLFFLIFHLLAWLVGWPGPFLWFGSESRLADILSVAVSVPAAAFFLNLFGAATLMALAALIGRFRTGV